MFGDDLIRSLFFAAAAFLTYMAFGKNKLKPAYAMIALLLVSSIDVMAEGRRYLNSDTFIEPESMDESYFAPSAADAQILRYGLLSCI